MRFNIAVVLIGCSLGHAQNPQRGGRGIDNNATTGKEHLIIKPENEPPASKALIAEIRNGRVPHDDPGLRGANGGLEGDTEEAKKLKDEAKKLEKVAEELEEEANVLLEEMKPGQAAKKIQKGIVIIKPEDESPAAKQLVQEIEAGRASGLHGGRNDIDMEIELIDEAKRLSKEMQQMKQSADIEFAEVEEQEKRDEEEYKAFNLAKEQEEEEGGNGE